MRNAAATYECRAARSPVQPRYRPAGSHPEKRTEILMAMRIRKDIMKVKKRRPRLLLPNRCRA
jgi:hypothetical protein